MTDTSRELLMSALVQAVIDSDDHPDGPVLSQRFWNVVSRDPELRIELAERLLDAKYGGVT